MKAFQSRPMGFTEAIKLCCSRILLKQIICYTDGMDKVKRNFRSQSSEWNCFTATFGRRTIATSCKAGKYRADSIGN